MSMEIRKALALHGLQKASTLIVGTKENALLEEIP
jgi:hypothetical protein